MDVVGINAILPFEDFLGFERIGAHTHQFQRGPAFVVVPSGLLPHLHAETTCRAVAPPHLEGYPAACIACLMMVGLPQFQGTEQTQLEPHPVAFLLDKLADARHFLDVLVHIRGKQTRRIGIIAILAEELVESQSELPVPLPLVGLHHFAKALEALGEPCCVVDFLVWIIRQIRQLLVTRQDDGLSSHAHATHPTQRHHQRHTSLQTILFHTLQIQVLLFTISLTNLRIFILMMQERHEKRTENLQVPVLFCLCEQSIVLFLLRCRSCRVCCSGSRSGLA